MQTDFKYMKSSILLVCSLAISSLDLYGESMTYAAADKATLAVGSDAPALTPGKWLKGGPITSFDPQKVYIVECWATWCGPCVSSIPHLNALYNTFKDQGLVVIGVSVMRDSEEKAAAFVARKGDKMAYLVAHDGKDGRVENDWLDAAGVRGIPHAFLVRKGKIIWQGHPDELSEENIRNVLKGGDMVIKPPEEIARLDEAVVRFRVARLEVLALLRDAEIDQALAKISEKESILAGTDPADPDVLRGMAFSIKGDRENSLAHYRKAVTAARGDPGALFRVAYGLMDFGSVRDNDLALQCAREAATKDPNPFFREMLARTEHAAGNKETAIAILEKLVAEEDSDQYREELRALKEGEQIPPPAGRGARR